jgi:cellobiose transport system substrate-binding protein
MQRFLIALILVLAGVSGCTGGNNEDTRIKLVVDDFGNFGYKTLLQDYMKAHPDILVTERVREFQDHHKALADSLDSGTGAGDVVGIEEAFIVANRSRAQDFLNLLDYGAGQLAGNWLPWKWQESMTPDGTYQIGLGTDVGGLAMCFRPDLFLAAGLPTDREAVAALWPTWEAYIAAGERFGAAHIPAQWTDSASNIFNQVLSQQEVGYFNTANQLIAATSPGVHRAWDVSMAMISAGESAKYVPFNYQWVAALQGGRFATLTCPAWILGWIQQNAPSTRGAWDVARVPGGAGNWGGSWLTIPKQTKHPAEAYALASWLTAPEQQLRIFIETGNLPSQPALYTNPVVANFTSSFFHDAPVGKIFTNAVQLKPPQYLGKGTGLVRKVFEDNISNVETGAKTPAQAWTDALTQSERVAGR